MCECKDQPDALSSTRIQQSSEWASFDWILSEQVYRSAWCFIQYENAALIGVAKFDWILSDWVQRSGWYSIQYQNAAIIRVANFDWILSEWMQRSAWCSIQYQNTTIIRVAKFWLNTKCVSAKISLMLYPVLECSNHQSGQVLIEY
jgi:hypothetical protein